VPAPPRPPLDRHRLLRRALEVPLFLRARAQPLDRVQQLLLLPQERVAELLHPFELLVHQRQDLGKHDERLHAVVPRLFLELLVELIALEARIVLDEPRRLDDLERVRRGHQDLRQQ
jgi:hypothetical protein